MRLNPVPVITPFDWLGQGHFQVATFPGTFAAFAAGTRNAARGPMGDQGRGDGESVAHPRPARSRADGQRMRDLEQTRTLAVDDAAARLRRLERDLHDGAQIRLATVTLNLGMAKKKLGGHGEVADAEAARELVDAALQGAKDALNELRELAQASIP